MYLTKPLGISHDGWKVNDRYDSHLSSEVEKLVRRALEHLEMDGREYLVEEYDFGYKIGQTICVATNLDDKIFFAQRPGKRGRSRFVENREPESCSFLTIFLKKVRDDDDCEHYICIVAFIGRKPEPEPWDEENFRQRADPVEAKKRSLEFWANHAFTKGGKPIILATVTTICPW